LQILIAAICKVQVENRKRAGLTTYDITQRTQTTKTTIN